MNIPDYCYSLNNMTINPTTGIGQIIKIKALESGYYKTSMLGIQEDVDKMNTELGVSRAEEEAMSTGSMFGWELYANCLKRFEEIYGDKENG